MLHFENCAWIDSVLMDIYVLRISRVFLLWQERGWLWQLVETVDCSVTVIILWFSHHPFLLGHYQRFLIVLIKWFWGLDLWIVSQTLTQHQVCWSSESVAVSAAFKITHTAQMTAQKTAQITAHAQSTAHISVESLVSGCDHLNWALAVGPLLAVCRTFLSL